MLRHGFGWIRMSMSAGRAYWPDRSQAALVFQAEHGSYNTDSLIEFLTDLYGHPGRRPRWPYTADRPGERYRLAKQPAPAVCGSGDRLPYEGVVPVASLLRPGEGAIREVQPSDQCHEQRRAEHHHRNRRAESD